MKSPNKFISINTSLVNYQHVYHYNISEYIKILLQLMTLTKSNASLIILPLSIMMDYLFISYMIYHTIYSHNHVCFQDMGEYGRYYSHRCDNKMHYDTLTYLKYMICLYKIRLYIYITHVEFFLAM